MYRNHEMRVLYWFRRYQIGGVLSRKLSMLMMRHYRRLYGIELPYNQNTGYGLRLIHPWCITVNANAVLGNNVTLYKGCTIGEIVDGRKKGVPNIGDGVTLYANSTVCGNVHIGNNVEIAAGAFVNFDVPDNSVVIGNPGVIHNKQ